MFAKGRNICLLILTPPHAAISHTPESGEADEAVLITVKEDGSNVVAVNMYHNGTSHESLSVILETLNSAALLRGQIILVLDTVIVFHNRATFL